MLAREFGAWPMLIRADHNAKVVGEFGNLVVKQGDVVSIYRALDGYFVTAGPIANLISTEDAEELFGHSVESAPTIEVKDEKDLRQKIKYAKEWLEYLDHWKMPRYVDSLVDRNGNPLDLHRFFNGINNKEDYQYALDYIKWRLGNQQVYYHLNLVSVGRSNASPEEVLRAIYTIYQYSWFNPEVNMVGMDTLNLWRLSDFSSSWTLARLGITLPFKDDYGDIHTNIDFGANPDWVVHNPFIQPVKVHYVTLWFDDRKFRNLEEAYEAGALNASIHFWVTPPDGKPVEFYFAHLKVEKGFGTWRKLNISDAKYISYGTYSLYVHGAVSINPGETISHLDNPKDDPASEGWHIEFGPEFGVKDVGIGKVMAYAMLFPETSEHIHQYLDQYLPLPKEQGYWLGKKHVVSYQPTVPAVAVRQPDGTIAFANINPYKKEPGWKSQLPASARFSKYPKAAFRRRA